MICNFDAVEGDELSVRVGDVVEILDNDGEWTTGTLRGKTGVFPSTHYKMLATAAAPVRPPKPGKKSLTRQASTGPASISSPLVASRRTGQAIRDYDAMRDDELTIREGDVIEIIRDDGEWATGTLNGKTGAFPLTFVKMAPQRPAKPGKLGSPKRPQRPGKPGPQRPAKPGKSFNPVHNMLLPPPNKPKRPVVLLCIWHMRDVAA